MAAHQRRTLSVSAVKHPSARVPAVLNQDAMSNTDNIVLDHIFGLFLPTRCRVHGLTPEEIRIVEEASA
ncbi:MAG: hypothetical protein WCQ21_16300 [Verrucomicrobiota bacterium]|jgi:hypothetical protein